MPITEPFEEHTDRYEGWFEAHDYAYQSELRALERLVPDDPDGIEIGVGTGRFAAPLGVQTGIDPAPGMLQRAAERDIAVARGVAEALPFADGAFGTALLVTTVCFVDDLNRTFEEARRVIRSGGRVVVGYIDRESPLGDRYQERKDGNPFYRDATFLSTADLIDALKAAGFDDFEFAQTVFRMPEELTEPDRVADGYGEGSFVGISARK
jgi:SAM-dependent methyltransferase